MSIYNQKTEKRTKIKIDSLVFSTGYVSKRLEIDVLISSIPNYHIIGDCNKPGRLVDAISQGFDIASKI